MADDAKDRGESGGPAFDENVRVVRLSRRRKLIVNRALQRKLLFSNLISTVVFCCVVGLVLCLPAMVALEDLGTNSHARLKTALQLIIFHEVFWPTLAVAVLVVYLHSLRTSHRIAGPLHRFTRCFAEIGRGKIPEEVRIRTRDMLHPEAEALDRMCKSLRIRVGAIQDAQAALAEVLADAEESPGLPEELLEDLRCRRRALDDAVARLAPDAIRSGEERQRVAS